MGYVGAYFGVSDLGAAGDVVQSISSGALEKRTPIVAVLQMAVASGLFIVYRSGTNRFMIYDPVDGFIAAFADQSTIEIDGTIRTVSILPNGGWWASDFNLMFVSGSEITE